MYIRRGNTSSTVLLYLEGGGFCDDARTCAGRAYGDADGDADGDGGAHSQGHGGSAAWKPSCSRCAPLLTEGSEPQHRALCDATHVVYLRYCSGDRWTGTLGSGRRFEGDNRSYTFGGTLILTAALRKLRAEGLLRRGGTRLFGGQSAGGVGAANIEEPSSAAACVLSNTLHDLEAVSERRPGTTPIARELRSLEELLTLSLERRRRTPLSGVLKGAWDSVDLAPFDRLAAALDGAHRQSSEAVTEGHSAQIQDERKLYVSLARLPHVEHICEIGFNGGHSASLWLMANPRAKVTMFDIWSHPYAATGEAFLRDEAAMAAHGVRDADGRLAIIKGSSHDTLPPFAAAQPRSCDIVSVDGDHSYDGAVQDLLDSRALLRDEKSLLLLDDTNCGSPWCVDRALDTVVNDGHYQVLLRQNEGSERGSMDKTRGVTLMRRRDDEPL